MRVLITGITGFAGSHLAEYILANHPDVEVFGIVRWRSRMDNIVADPGQGPAHRGRHQGHGLPQGRPGRSRSPTASSTSPPRASSPTSWTLPGRDVRHQRHRRDQPVRGRAGPRPQAEDPDRRLERGVRAGLLRRDPDEGDQPPPAAEPVRREQGRPGPPGLPVLQELRAEDGPDARLQPHRAAAGRRVRDVVLRQADRRDREEEAAAGHLRRQPRGQARLHRRPRHGPGLLAGPGARSRGRGLQHRARAGVLHEGGPRPADVPQPGQDGGPGRPGAAPAVGRARPARRQLEVHRA